MIYNIQSWVLNNKIIFYDIIVNNNFIYLISPNHSDSKEQFIHVSIENINIPLSKKIVQDGYTNILILMYEINFKLKLSDKVNVLIAYKEFSKMCLIDSRPSSYTCKNEMSVTTLFKGDYKLIPLFYNYYKTLGFKHFFLYYNDILTTEIIDICNKPDITLIEWNFPYMRISDCPELYKGPIHNAQLGQMHHALYNFGKNRYKYMAFLDLDEYIEINNIKLHSYLETNNINCLGFTCKWAKTSDDNIPLKFPKSFLVEQTIRTPYYKSKFIYNTHYISCIDVHYPKLVRLNDFIPNLFFYHFYSWSGKKRKIHLENPIIVNL